jgi:hypothetical protein
MFDPPRSRPRIQAPRRYPIVMTHHTEVGRCDSNSKPSSGVRSCSPAATAASRRSRQAAIPVGAAGACSSVARPNQPARPLQHCARGPVAQLVEQGTFNPKVAGSRPARPIRNCLHKAMFALGAVSVQLTRVNNRERYGCDNKRNDPEEVRRKGRLVYGIGHGTDNPGTVTVRRSFATSGCRHPLLFRGGQRP